MALQPYNNDSAKALALLPQLTPEERERREKEAEVLDEKLRYIVENVPDRVYHVMGSNAGAGSGEFHTYRASRRREQERQARMEAEFQEAKKLATIQERVSRLAEIDEERTAQRRAKRQKKKAKAASRSKGTSDSGGEAGQDAGAPSSHSPAAAAPGDHAPPNLALD
ncbi:hypothetical protein ACKKBG_A29980 [Auxenochlorella protothecoides x Auxenochlorella symbiontica]